MNYAIVFLGGILFFSTLYWFIQGHKWYTGPLIEAELEEDSDAVDRNSDEGIEKKGEPQREIGQVV